MTPSARPVVSPRRRVGLRPYLAVFAARFRTLLQYRAAAVAGFGTQLFWGFIRVMIFTAFYRSTTLHQPMSLGQTVTYVWLGQAFFGLLPWWPEKEVQAMIRSGAVAYELLRPLDLYSLWFLKSVASRTAPTLLRSVPMVAAATLWLGMAPPPSWASAGAFALCLIGTVALVSAYTTLMTVTLLWTIAGDGIARLAPALAYTMGGMLIPLPFFPGWVQPLLDLLPFKQMADVPFRLYMGHIPPAAIGAIVLHQAVWSVILVACGRALLAKATRRLVVQGG